MNLVVRRHALTRLLAVSLMACFTALTAKAAGLGLDGGSWAILYSRNCPPSPTTVMRDDETVWRLQVRGICEPHYVMRGAGDLTRLQLEEEGASLSVTMQIANARLRSVQDGGTSTYATVMLQRAGDNLSGEGKYAHYRQWALSHRIALADGTFTVTIPLDRENWKGVWGAHAPEAAWKDLLANLGRVGISLGGRSDAGHGIKGVGDLYMLEFKVE